MQARVPSTLSPSSRADLEQRRRGVLAVGPSGAVYRVRKPSLRRHLDAGSLPLELRRLTAMRSAVGAAESGGPRDLTEEDLEALGQAEVENRAQNDRLVLATVIEPPLELADLGTGELDDDPVLPALDYDWLLGVAQGSVVRDAEDRMIFGPEPRSRFESFQRHHSCGDDCAACAAVIAEFSSLLAAE